MEAGSSVSLATSRAIYDDAREAYSVEEHPCHLFRWLQTGVPDADWQLPEPFNGRSANAGVIFLGLNPSYDPNEGVPRIASTFAEWDMYYRARFDSPSEGWHKLYRRYQRVGELATSDAFRLGIDAVVLEVIRFRSAGGAGCKDPSVLRHEVPMTGRLLEELAPRVVIANGSGALWGVQTLWPEIQNALPLGTPLHIVEHKTFHVETPWGRVGIVPTRHLSASFGFPLVSLEPLARSVAAVLSE